ncbi:TPA: NAD-binding protein [Neisseria bacilliformis]|uniref:NAD-binding protein n=1 Tax=Neisseria bacilliformis TaxID=267212 RepID=UPI001EFA109D|nr:NAD-binding protein [Neisseria bacilliformis]
MVLTPLLLILHGRLPKKATAERGDDAIEKAAVLVVAIDNKEQALQIVRFAREANPNIKIVARAYDRRHTFDLYQADADEIVRETFDSGIRAGKRVLEALGLPREKAEKVGGIFFRMDRRGMHKMAVLYNPAIAGYTNRALMEEAQRQDDRVREAVQAFLRGEEDVDESVQAV